MKRRRWYRQFKLDCIAKGDWIAIAVILAPVILTVILCVLAR